MAAPVFTVDNLADHAAAYRARIEQRRVLIESRPHEKRFSLTEPPPGSKEFVKAMVDLASVVENYIRDDADRYRKPFHQLNSAEDVLARAYQRELIRLGREYIEAARDGDGDLVRSWKRDSRSHGPSGAPARQRFTPLPDHARVLRSACSCSIGRIFLYATGRDGSRPSLPISMVKTRRWRISSASGSGRTLSPRGAT
jgi:hypothetical protein